MTESEKAVAAAWYLRGFVDGFNTPLAVLVEKYPHLGELRGIVSRTAKTISEGGKVNNPLYIYDMVECAEKLGFPK